MARRVIGIRVSEETARLLHELSKAQGRTISSVAGELLTKALRNEVKESRDLERFMSMLAGLSASLQQVVLRQGPSLTKEDFVLGLEILAQYWFLDATKRQKFIEELYSKFGGGR
ncbi:MAG: hypothetical protein QW561_02595 [Candidatus Aenigmatarchaeota archaeon]